jgi:hypothetical protein
MPFCGTLRSLSEYWLPKDCWYSRFPFPSLFVIILRQDADSTVYSGEWGSLVASFTNGDLIRCAWGRLPRRELLSVSPERVEDFWRVSQINGEGHLYGVGHTAPQRNCGSV